MEETISLPTAGAIPGIPGEHAAGIYLINWAERSIRPVAQDMPPEPEPVAEEEPKETQPLASEPQND